MTSKVYIDATASVHDSASLEDGAMIWNWTKVRENARIGAGTRIGQCAFVDAGVRIGARCKVQNGVSLYQGVSLADDVFVGPNVTFTNDFVPRAHGPWHIIETVVERGASVGANATIVCGVTLGRHCFVAAGATVTRDVPPFALVMGTPARVVDYVTVAGRRLQRDPALGQPGAELVEDRRLPERTSIDHG